MSLPTMLFVRQYPFFLGGHLKVFDYFNHVAASGRYKPLLYLTPDSIDPKPLLSSGATVLPQLCEADAYFVAGANWLLLDRAGIDVSDSLVLNLIQGFRHLPGSGAHETFLARAATRICVSEPLAQALRSTGKTNGPIVTIPNGIDIEALRCTARLTKAKRVFIAGQKDPESAKAVAVLLERSGIAADACIDLVPRDEFLERMSRSQVTVALPLPEDGFYLPAIEAMAVGSALVISDYPGPSAVCRSGWNCIVTSPRHPELLASAARRIIESSEERSALTERARETANQHSLSVERARFFSLLDRLTAKTSP